MSRLILAILAGVLLCGFALPETPAERTIREKEARVWRKSITKAYDLKALHAFLEKRIHAITIVDGLELAFSKIQEKWKFDELYPGLSCGNWNFSTKVVKSP